MGKRVSLESYLEPWANAPAQPQHSNPIYLLIRLNYSYMPIEIISILVDLFELGGYLAFFAKLKHN